AHRRAEQPRLAEEEPRHCDLGLDAPRRAAGNDAAAHGERAHRLFERGRANVLEDDVDAIAGGLADRLAEGRRIEDGVGAELERSLALALGPASGEDA